MECSIGEAAKRIGISASALRYYDKEGLLPDVKRSIGGVRVFSDADFRWLHLIDCMKKAGMSIAEIKEYLFFMKQGDETIPARLALFKKRKDKLEEQIKGLEDTKKVLEYKIWFYQKAKELGSVDKIKDIPLETVPKPFQRRFLETYGKR